MGSTGVLGCTITKLLSTADEFSRSRAMVTSLTTDVGRRGAYISAGMTAEQGHGGSWSPLLGQEHCRCRLSAV